MGRAQNARVARSRTLKIVVAGPFGAGKTTFIRTISDTPVLSTERDVTDHTRALKAQTTVAMDFGRVGVDQDLALFLFGTPGQERFDFMWDILGTGMLGFVLMVDGHREECLEEAARVLRFLVEAGDVPFVVAVNKVEGDEDVERLRGGIDLPAHVPMLRCDARERESVKEVLVALLETVRRRAHGEVEASGAGA